MSYNNIVNGVDTKEKFIEFMNELVQDRLSKGDEWENKDISSYIEGISSWVEDMEGYYRNMNLEMPKNIDWQFIATLFYVGKIYE